MKKLILLFSFLNAFCVGAQGIDNLWRMGYASYFGDPQYGGIDMNFLSGSLLISHPQRKMNYGDNSATICDSLGQLLFSTNGFYIENALGDTMVNGSGLNPSYYTAGASESGFYIPQASLIIPFPGNSNKYFLIHSTIDDSIAYSYKTYYTLIDMTLDGGLGAVVSKNNLLNIGVFIAGRITGVKHANGRDWWVVVHEGNSNNYLIYLIDQYGIHFFATQSIGAVQISDKGQFCFSPDGTKFAQYSPTNDLDIMDFDRCGGMFSNVVHVPINDSAGGGGVAFSPNSNVLYVSSTSYLYQFDLLSSNIPLSKTTVAIWDTTYSPNPPFATTFYLSQLAPDGKIYISTTNSTIDIHVIDYPDSLGFACQVCQHCVHLQAYDAFTIPNMPSYHLGSLPGSICDTLTSSIAAISVGVEGFSIFPNPAKDLVYLLNKSKSIPKSILVENAIGELFQVHMSFLNNGEYIEMNIENLKPGIYFIVIIQDEKKRTLKMVKV